jgi:hypothetical protein
MRSVPRLAFGLAALAVLAGCSENGDIFAPKLLSPESATLDPVASIHQAPVAMAGAPSYTETWDGRGTDSEKCEDADGDLRPATGWIHWVFSTKGNSTDASLILGGTGSGTYSPGPPLNAEVWHFYTPYFELEGLTATINLFGGDEGPGGGLVISDYCPGEFERLEVEKTVKTEFDRKHLWDIRKKVTTENGFTLDGYPKIWLYADGSGDEKATWTVDVLYKNFQDLNHRVFGDIKIENTGTLDAVITSVTDVLAGESIPVSCPVTFPYTLEVGKTLTCTYSKNVPNKVAGSNVATVTTERDTYSDTKPIVWGAPKTEIDKTVNISDVSTLFGTKNLGTATAPNNAQFTYTKDFAWEDYGAEKCGGFSYPNTARIVQTNQTASATLKVNVQCILAETAYAKADDPKVLTDCFIPTFAQWGWTNRIPKPYDGTWDLWAGAAHCDTSRGTFAGTVDVKLEEDGRFTVDIQLEDGFHLLEQHVYAGSTRFPKMQQGRRLVDTVAPGQYYIEDGLSGNTWVIVHAVVGAPDPNFGPPG